MYIDDFRKLVELLEDKEYSIQRFDGIGRVKDVEEGYYVVVGLSDEKEVPWKLNERKYVKVKSTYFVLVNENGFLETDPFEEKEMEELYIKKIKKEMILEMIKEKERRRNELENKKEEYEARKRQLVRLSQEINSAMLFIYSNDQEKKIEEKITNELKNIKENKFVKEIKFSNMCIEILFDNLKCTEPKTEKMYALGDVKMYINTYDGEVTFGATENTRTAVGYWGGQQVHPHVDTGGYPCLGTADAMLAQFFADKELYAMVLTALNYLQTCNVEDVAGYGISKWDEVDEEGNVIREGHAPEEDEYGYSSSYYTEYRDTLTCSECGEEIECGDEYGCYECGRVLCDACAIHDGDRYLCPDCHRELNE